MDYFYYTYGLLPIEEFMPMEEIMPMDVFYPKAETFAQLDEMVEINPMEEFILWLSLSEWLSLFLLLRLNQWMNLQLSIKGTSGDIHSRSTSAKSDNMLTKKKVIEHEKKRARRKSLHRNRW